MWVSKTIGANVDLQIRSGDILANVFSFSESGSPYSLAAITPTLKIYAPGNDTALVTLIVGDGLAKSANTITTDKLIELATGMYRYELIFDFSDPDLVDAIVIDGAFWVRKNIVNTTATHTITVLTTPPSVDADVTIQNITTYVPGPQGPPGEGIDQVVNEVPAGDVNGSNAIYTTEFDFVPESVEVFINGLVQKPGTHFTTSGTTSILMNESPVTGDQLLVNYQKA